MEAYFETEDRRTQAKVSLDAFLRNPEISPGSKARRRGAAPRRLGPLDVRLRRVLALERNCVCRSLVKAAAARESSERSPNEVSDRDRITMRPPYARVVAYAHQNEVARGNSTGNLIPATLPFGELLVAGLAEHEARLERVLRENEGRVAVLWPRPTMAFAEIRERMRDARRDGRQQQTRLRRASAGHSSPWTTWNSARKMVSRIPASVPRVSVPAEAFQALAKRVPPLPTHDSLLGPVRKTTPALAAPKKTTLMTRAVGRRSKPSWRRSWRWARWTR